MTGPQQRRARARRAVARWERMQGRYAFDREARTDVVTDVLVAAIGDCGPASVVELGCGPGVMTTRLTAELPERSGVDVEVVGVDADPFLIALGRLASGGQARLVEALVGTEGWRAALQLRHPVAAVLASAVLHYPDRDTLASLYRDLLGLLRPGGVLVNADHLPDRAPAIAALQRESVAAVAGAGPDWGAWWAEVAADRALRSLAPTDAPVAPAVDGDNGLDVIDHLELLADAGATEAGVVWRHGVSAVLVATR